MEAEKSHGLPSASWRTREARGNLVQVQKTKDQELGVQGQEKMDVSAQEEKENSLFLFFVLFGPSTDWTEPTCTGEGDLYSDYRFKC